MVLDSKCHGEEHSLLSQAVWGQILAPPSNSWVTLDKLLTLSVPPLPHLQNGVVTAYQHQGLCVIHVLGTF